MTRRKQGQRTLWEGVVNEDVRALWEPWMVEADKLLEGEELVEHNSFSEFYLTDLDPRGSMGLGGKEEAEIGSGGTYLTAVDYSTGKIACVITITAMAEGAAACSRPQAGWSLAAMARAVWWRMMPRPAIHFGTHALERYKSTANLSAGWPSVCDRSYGG